MTTVCEIVNKHCTHNDDSVVYEDDHCCVMRIRTIWPQKSFRYTAAVVTSGGYCATYHDEMTDAVRWARAEVERELAA